jgi:hypothetical protein
MAGRVQLATRGTQDVFFTDNPEYTYFIKNFKRHTHFAKYSTDHDVTGEIEFGSTLRCKIPQNTGDLLKTVGLRIQLSAIPQSTVGYTESIGHAIVEYVELYIGDTLVQRVPRDFLQIHSEHYITQTKQTNLHKLIGKPSEELSGTPVYSSSILGHLGPATAERTCIVDVPFYFYTHPELAIPLCALSQQECEIVIKLAPQIQCMYDIDTLVPYQTDQKGLIKECKVVTEMIHLGEPERIQFQETYKDYIITQIQSDSIHIPGTTEPSQDIKHTLQFINPVKELYFVFQTLSNTYSPFDYDHPLQQVNGKYTNYEHLTYAELILDNEVFLNDVTGNYIHLRAVQSGIHHSRTQLFRRFYSYSFALEPERWYPTGQVNFSLIKEQLLRMRLNGQMYDLVDGGDGRLVESLFDRELRVYALSFNILRIENGTARLLFGGN